MREQINNPCGDMTWQFPLQVLDGTPSFSAATAIKDPEKKIFITKIIGPVRWLHGLIPNKYSFINGSDIKGNKLTSALPLPTKENKTFPSDLWLKSLTVFLDIGSSLRWGTVLHFHLSI